MTKQQIGQAIRSRRKALRIYQSELAQKAGVMTATVIEVEKGRNFTANTLIAILDVLNMSIEIKQNEIETVIKDLKRSLENVKEYPERGVITMLPQDAQILLNAENTVMWWLCRIADDEVRRKAVGNVTNKSKLIEEEEDFENAVYSAFEWSPTEEGHDYWKSVATSEIPLLPTPEWKEYLELRK